MGIEPMFQVLEIRDGVAVIPSSDVKLSAMREKYNRICSGYAGTMIVEHMDGSMSVESHGILTMKFIKEETAQ